MKGNQT